MIKKAPHLILIIKVKSSLLSRFLVTLERAWSLATLDTVNLPCWKSLITLALNTHTHTQGVSHSFLPCSLPLLPVFPLPLSYLLVVPQHRDSDDLTIMGAHVLSRFSHVRLFATLWTTACQTPLHGMLQARILEWVAVPFSRESSQPRHQTCDSYVSCIALAGRFFTTSATWEAHDNHRVVVNMKCN